MKESIVDTKGPSNKVNQQELLANKDGLKSYDEDLINVKSTVENEAGSSEYVDRTLNSFKTLESATESFENSDSSSIFCKNVGIFQDNSTKPDFNLARSFENTDGASIFCEKLDLYQGNLTKPDLANVAQGSVNDEKMDFISDEGVITDVLGENQGEDSGVREEGHEKCSKDDKLKVIIDKNVELSDKQMELIIDGDVIKASVSESQGIMIGGVELEETEHKKSEKYENLKIILDENMGNEVDNKKMELLSGENNISATLNENLEEILTQLEKEHEEGKKDENLKTIIHKDMDTKEIDEKLEVPKEEDDIATSLNENLIVIWSQLGKDHEENRKDYSLKTVIDGNVDTKVSDKELELFGGDDNITSVKNILDVRNDNNLKVIRDENLDTKQSDLQLELLDKEGNITSMKNILDVKIDVLSLNTDGIDIENVFQNGNEMDANKNLGIIEKGYIVSDKTNSNEDSNCSENVGIKEEIDNNMDSNKNLETKGKCDIVGTISDETNSICRENVDTKCGINNKVDSKKSLGTMEGADGEESFGKTNLSKNLNSKVNVKVEGKIDNEIDLKKGLETTNSAYLGEKYFDNTNLNKASNCKESLDTNSNKIDSKKGLQTTKIVVLDDNVLDEANSNKNLESKESVDINNGKTINKPEKKKSLSAREILKKSIEIRGRRLERIAVTQNLEDVSTAGSVLGENSGIKKGNSVDKSGKETTTDGEISKKLMLTRSQRLKTCKENTDELAVKINDKIGEDREEKFDKNELETAVERSKKSLQTKRRGPANSRSVAVGKPAVEVGKPVAEVGRPVAEIVKPVVEAGIENNSVGNSVCKNSAGKIKLKKSLQTRCEKKIMDKNEENNFEPVSLRSESRKKIITNNLQNNLTPFLKESVGIETQKSVNSREECSPVALVSRKLRKRTAPQVTENLNTMAVEFDENFVISDERFGGNSSDGEILRNLFAVERKLVKTVNVENIDGPDLGFQENVDIKEEILENEEQTTNGEISKKSSQTRNRRLRNRAATQSLEKFPTAEFELEENLGVTQENVENFVKNHSNLGEISKYSPSTRLRKRSAAQNFENSSAEEFEFEETLDIKEENIENFVENHSNFGKVSRRYSQIKGKCQGKKTASQDIEDVAMPSSKLGNSDDSAKNSNSGELSLEVLQNLSKTVENLNGSDKNCRKNLPKKVGRPKNVGKNSGKVKSLMKNSASVSDSQENDGKIDNCSVTDVKLMENSASVSGSKENGGKVDSCSVADVRYLMENSASVSGSKENGGKIDDCRVADVNWLEPVQKIQKRGKSGGRTSKFGGGKTKKKRKPLGNSVVVIQNVSNNTKLRVRNDLMVATESNMAAQDGVDTSGPQTLATYSSNHVSEDGMRMVIKKETDSSSQNKASSQEMYEEDVFVYGNVAHKIRYIIRQEKIKQEETVKLENENADNIESSKDNKTDEIENNNDFLQIIKEEPTDFHEEFVLENENGQNETREYTINNTDEKRNIEANSIVTQKNVQIIRFRRRGHARKSYPIAKNVNINDVVSRCKQTTFDKKNNKSNQNNNKFFCKYTMAIKSKNLENVNGLDSNSTSVEDENVVKNSGSHKNVVKKVTRRSSMLDNVSNNSNESNMFNDSNNSNSFNEPIINNSGDRKKVVKKIARCLSALDKVCNDSIVPSKSNISNDSNVPNEFNACNESSISNNHVKTISRFSSPSNCKNLNFVSKNSTITLSRGENLMSNTENYVVKNSAIKSSTRDLVKKRANFNSKLDSISSRSNKNISNTTNSPSNRDLVKNLAKLVGKLDSMSNKIVKNVKDSSCVQDLDSNKGVAKNGLDLPHIENVLSTSNVLDLGSNNDPANNSLDAISNKHVSNSSNALDPGSNGNLVTSLVNCVSKLDSISGNNVSNNESSSDLISNDNVANNLSESVGTTKKDVEYVGNLSDNVSTLKKDVFKNIRKSSRKRRLVTNYFAENVTSSDDMRNLVTSNVNVEKMSGLSTSDVISNNDVVVKTVTKKLANCDGKTKFDLKNESMSKSRIISSCTDDDDDINNVEDSVCTLQSISKCTSNVGASETNSNNDVWNCASHFGTPELTSNYCIENDCTSPVKLEPNTVPIEVDTVSNSVDTLSNSHNIGVCTVSNNVPIDVDTVSNIEEDEEKYSPIMEETSLNEEDEFMKTVKSFLGNEMDEEGEGEEVKVRKRRRRQCELPEIPLSLKCNICERVLKTRQSYMHHISTHTDPSKQLMKCTCCKKVLAGKRRLEKHMKNFHTFAKTFVCEICNKIFHVRGNLYQHMVSVHLLLKMYTCDICKKSFKKKTYLQEHIAMHMGVRKHVCPLCDKNFMNKMDLSNHLDAHMGFDRYVCGVCGKRMSSLGTMHRHMKQHTHENMHKCKHCGKEYAAKSSLQQHMNLHSGKKYTCETCGAKFYYRNGYNRHVKTHDGKQEECNICHKVFQRKCYLKKHMTIHLGTEQFMCVYCGKKFIDKSDYNKHVNTHTHAEKFPCDFCSKVFHNKAYMLSHRKIHTGDTKHVCNYCGKKFMKRGLLDRHVSIHEGTNFVQCDLCEAVLSSVASCKRHVWNVHGVNRYCS